MAGKYSLESILGSDSSFTNMTKTEREYFIKLIQEEISKREETSKPVQLREIVPIEDWIMSEYYTGIPSDQIYDYWKDLIVDIFRQDRKPEEKINQLILSGSIGIGKSCINENTRIPTTIGNLKIKDLYKKFHDKGKRFCVLAETGIKECVDVIDNGIDNTKIITFKSGKCVEGTGKHKFRVIRDGKIEWVRFDDIKIGDKTLMNRKLSLFGKESLDKTSTIRNSSLNSSLFSKENLDLSMAYTLGFETGNRLNYKNDGIPEFIFSCNKETVSMFIQGIMDFSGIIEKSGNISITLNSEKCIKQLGELLSMFGINYAIQETDKNEYQLSIVDNESYSRYSKYIGFGIDYKNKKLLNRIAKNKEDDVVVPFATSELRKLNKIDKLSGRIYKKFTKFKYKNTYTLGMLKELYLLNKSWVCESEYLKYVCENDVYFDEVVNIENGKCHTYDLTVWSDHSYCFNGFISHNTCAELVVLRKLYEMSCWRNINALYHLMSKTNIMFMYFSVNKIQAERTGYGDIKRLIDSCPYFQQNFARKSRLDSILAFPEGITIAYGSNENHTIGMSTICSVLDEANFMGSSNGPANPERALEMYTSLVNRSNSRFIIDGGINHSLNILVSSSTTDSSVTERQIAASRDDPHTLICAPSQWEVKPDKFSKKFFYVCKGTDYLEPYIVRSTDDVNNFRVSEGLPISKYVDGIEEFDKIKEEIEKLPPHQQAKFLKVPEDLRRGFESNMLRSLQDIGGVSVGSTGKLFNSVAVYNACIDDRFQHPFVSESITISTGDRIEIWDYLKSNFRLKHPERPRYMHIDQSYRTDDTGIAMVYVDEVIKDETGVTKPVFGVDFIIQINPPKPPKKIALYKIRNFVVFLAQRIGVKFGMISYDIFNSEESRQILEEMGLPVKYQSVDRTDKAYLDCVEVMYEQRLRMYDYKIFRNEIFNVVHYRDKRKVDHTKTNADGSVGKKDTADALVGSIQNAIQAKISDSDNKSTLNDFLAANERNTLFEPDMMSVEDLVDKQIDDMIEDMEYGMYDNYLGGMTFM